MVCLTARYICYVTLELGTVGVTHSDSVPSPEVAQVRALPSVASATLTGGKKYSSICPTSNAQVCGQLISWSCDAAVYGVGQGFGSFSICVRRSLLKREIPGGCLATRDRVFLCDPRVGSEERPMNLDK